MRIFRRAGTGMIMRLVKSVFEHSDVHVGLKMVMRLVREESPNIQVCA